jgi:hypothetical protein
MQAFFWDFREFSVVAEVMDIAGILQVGML